MSTRGWDNAVATSLALRKAIAGPSRLKPNTKCEVCQKDFYASPGHKAQGWGRFCSMACRPISGESNPRWGGPSGDMTCEKCGKKFRIRPSRRSRGEGRFCSLDCKRQFKSTDRRCPGCQKVFRAYACRDERNVYCSAECHSATIAPQWNRTCDACGKWFYRKACDLKRQGKVNVGRFCSMRCKASGMVQRHHPAGGKRAKSGKRADLENRYFRSGWEANYARYLNWLQAQGQIDSWEYEVDTFEFPVKRGSKFYTPDFKVTERGRVAYHEVKGWMDARSATKLKRMGIHYPAVKVVLIDSKQYHAIAKTASKAVANWE